MRGSGGSPKIVACRQRAPDVEALAVPLAQDEQVSELLAEADALGDADSRGAARNLREIVLPRARANHESIGRIRVEHPRAAALRDDGWAQGTASVLSAHWSVHGVVASLLSAIRPSTGFTILSRRAMSAAISSFVSIFPMTSAS